MIQITKWINPDEETWYQETYITNLEWLMIQKEHLSKLTSKKVVIKTDSKGYKAVFRGRIK